MAKAQLIYTLAVLEKYQDTKTGLVNAQKAPKPMAYSSINKMLEESFLLGATKFGINYIF